MRILLTGASGQLGPYVVDALRCNDHEVVAWCGRSEVDLADADAVRRAFHDAAPDAVIHAAAMAKPAMAYQNPDTARAVNADATRQLVELADARHAKLVFVSTDMLFDGSAPPYRESDPPSPTSEYGRSKRAGENHTLDVSCNIVVRVSLLFGPSRCVTPSLFDQHVAALLAGQPIRVFDDEWRTPLAIDDAAAGLIAAATSTRTGLYHLGGPERLSRLDMGAALCELLDADASCLRPCSRLSIEADEPRPADLSFDCSRWANDFADVPRQTYAQATEHFLQTMKRQN